MDFSHGKDTGGEGGRNSRAEGPRGKGGTSCAQRGFERGFLKSPTYRTNGTGSININAGRTGECGKMYRPEKNQLYCKKKVGTRFDRRSGDLRPFGRKEKV